MKTLLITFLLACSFLSDSFAQQGSSATPMAIETLMLLPKRGMEEKFEAAVVAHNKKFHPEGPYYAGLRKIEYGEKAGWYVWIFGPVPYGSLDTRPTKENGHEQDWTTTVDPTVETYGGAGFLNYNTELSYGLDIFKKSKHYEVWGIDLKPKQFNRFKSLVGKLRKVYEEEGKTAFLVMENNLHGKDQADVLLVWSFDTYLAWQKDPGPKSRYEKMYGEGSWQAAMDEWTDMIVDYNSGIRSIIQ